MIDNFIHLMNFYCENQNITHWSASMRIYGRGNVFQRLYEKKGITVSTVDKGMQWFSDNWPHHLAWPCDITRPTPNNKKRAS